MFACARERAILKDKKRLIALLSLLVLSAVAVHLYSPAGWSSLSLKLLHSMHGPGFVVLTLAVFLSLRSWRRAPDNYAISAALLGSVIIVAEFMQLLVGRSAQLSDMLTDALAVAGTLGVIAIADRRITAMDATPSRLAIGVVAVLVLLYACAPAIWLGHVYIQQHRAFPVLLTNEHRWERDQFSTDGGRLPIQPGNPTGWPAGGTKILEAAPRGQHGIFLSLHPASDWTGYDQLSFVASSVDGPHDVMICIRESRATALRASKRLCRTVRVDVVPRKQTVSLFGRHQDSFEESINLGRIDAIVFSQARPGGAALLRLDNIVLEKLTVET